MTSRKDAGLTALLREILQQFDCTSGTIHRSEEGVLTLVAHEGIPDPVLAKIETVPIGKGMAGLPAVGVVLDRRLAGRRDPRRLVGWIGVVLGVLTVGTATISLVAVYGGDSVGRVLFDVATLPVPLLHLWAIALGVDIYR